MYGSAKDSILHDCSNMSVPFRWFPCRSVVEYLPSICAILHSILSIWRVQAGKKEQTFTEAEKSERKIGPNDIQKHRVGVTREDS